MRKPSPRTHQPFAVVSQDVSMSTTQNSRILASAVAGLAIAVVVVIAMLSTGQPRHSSTTTQPAAGAAVATAGSAD